MMRHKLHLQEQFIRHHGIHTENIRDAGRIKRCVDLLDRLIDDVHHDEAFEDHYKTGGHPEMTFKDIEDEIDGFLKDDEYVQLEIKYPNANTPLEKERETIDFRKASNKEASSRQADIDELFEIMRKHIQEWWD